MELQLKTENQRPAAPSARKASVLPAALFRLALLIGPEAGVIRLLSHNPLICALACVAVLGVWLSVDIGPFRAAGLARPAAQPATPAYASNLTKAEWWSYLFCKAVVFFALFHSKLTI